MPLPLPPSHHRVQVAAKKLQKRKEAFLQAADLLPAGDPGAGAFFALTASEPLPADLLSAAQVGGGGGHWDPGA